MSRHEPHRLPVMRRLRTIVSLALVVAGVVAALALWWVSRPLPLAAPAVEVSIEPGTPPRRVAELWVTAGVQVPPSWLYTWFRLSGQSRQIRAGSYEIETGTSARQLLEKMVRGDEVLEAVRFIEGWTVAQMRAALASAPGLRPLTRDLDEAQLMAALGVPGQRAEGRFFPDTYTYSRNVSDLTVLKRAHAAMQRRVDAAWAARAPDLPLASPDEALILASIVEKETGSEAARGKTYTRRGLPPTPIALPGAASLTAATQPARTRALYFVSRGDGSSVFSETLDDHNRAVNQYQRGMRAKP
jgi:UPF0755 protein